MIDTALNLIITYLPVFISTGALFVSFLVWRDAKRVNTHQAIVSKSEKRREHLVELERKNVAMGDLVLAIAKQLVLFDQYPALKVKYTDKYYRLKHQHNLLLELDSGRTRQRGLAEKALNGSATELHQQALSDTQRLRVHMEAELLKEQSEYIELKEAV